MKAAKLQDLTIQITDGKHGDCNNEDSSGYYFVSCKDVYDGSIHYEQSRQITKDDCEDVRRRIALEPGDSVITNSGTIGRMAFATDRPETSRTAFQKSVAVVKPNRDLIEPAYLYYLLLSCVADMARNSNGSAQKNLLLSTMREYELVFHESKAIQRRLVGIISAYDDLIENNRRQIALLEEAAQRLYKEWFIDLRFPGNEDVELVDGLPDGWTIGKLSEVLEIRNGKDHKALPDGTIPVYGSGGLMRRCSSALYEGESVLIPRKGTLNNVMYVNEAFWTVDTLFYTHVEMEYGAKYLYQVVKGYDLASLNIGAAVPSMTKAILNGLDVLIPPKSILKQYEGIVAPTFIKRDCLRRQADIAREARDRLLPKLMSGEIKVEG